MLPTKPKYYSIWFFLRVNCALGMLTSLIFNGLCPSAHYGYLAAFFGVAALLLIVLGRKFEGYHVLLAKHRQAAIDMNRLRKQTVSTQASNVNKNIAEYEKAQSLRKANKKWWEFWI
ncbi:hypothetical protein P886_1190 [Alteromonadaceae bacterium 2753L.S.0a.02]|nr:hypothetical protein P886_1190 [Alteromonadaceae bacterium 2753L.S.0a.02]